MTSNKAEIENLVSEICSDMKLKNEIEIEAKKIIDMFMTTKIAETLKSRYVAAGAIYISIILCNERMTQAAVAEGAGITINEMRKGYIAIRENVGIPITL